MRRRRQPVVPVELVERIDEAVTAVDDARADLRRVIAGHPELRERRQAYAEVRRAFAQADALLREACRLARQRGYHDWSLWRHRLSSLDVARQIHLFDEQDQPGLLPLGSVRAIDTGMSKPDIGELQHGQSRDPGALPTYGLDLEALLTAPVGGRRTTAGPQEPPFIGTRPERAGADEAASRDTPPQRAA